MKKHSIKLLILFISVIIVSCKGNNNDSILTGGSYKYWVVENYHGRSTLLEYFDSNGKCLPFIKIFNGGFEKVFMG